MLLENCTCTVIYVICDMFMSEPKMSSQNSMVILNLQLEYGV